MTTLPPNDTRAGLGTSTAESIVCTPEHDAEDRRTIAAVKRARAIYGPNWFSALPSLGRRLYDHVAVGDCPLGRLQAGGNARLIERRA